LLSLRSKDSHSARVVPVWSTAKKKATILREACGVPYNDFGSPFRFQVRTKKCQRMSH